jgi:hypothetical protein
MGPGGFDMQQIFAAAQQAMSAQQELANTEVIGTAGNGAVRAVVSGVGQLLDVTIDPTVIDPTDPAETASTVADRQLGALGGGFGGGLPAGLGDALGGGGGFDLSSLGLPGLGGPVGLDDDEYDDDDEDDEDDDDEDDDDLDDDDEVGPEHKEN